MGGEITLHEMERVRLGSAVKVAAVPDVSAGGERCSEDREGEAVRDRVLWRGKS